MKDLKKEISIPDTVMEPGPSDAFVYPVSLEEKVNASGLILPKMREVSYRNKEKIMVETKRRIIVKCGYQFKKALSIPIIKLFGFTIFRLCPRPGDEIVRYEIVESAANSPIMKDPNTMDEFELFHAIETRGIIFNSAMDRPWWEKLAIDKILHHENPRLI